MLRRETKAETRRGGGRTVGMTVIGTVAVSSAMAIRRTVIETMRDDRDTPTCIVSPIILGMMARVGGGRIGSDPVGSAATERADGDLWLPVRR